MRILKSRGFWLSVLLFVAICFGVWSVSRILISELSDTMDEGDTPAGVASVGLVRIEGGIFDARPAVENIEKLGKLSQVKALVLRIESPGGGVGPTQEIYEAVRRFRKSGRKVIASLGGVAASGGYYIAVASDKIYANPGTITGSIGVIMVLPNVEKVFGSLGISFNVIKSVPYKDLASPLRAMTAKEREILQQLVDDTYKQFVRAVAEGRKMSEEKTRTVADGRIYTGERAKRLGLVDKLGSQRDAVMEAAHLAGIKGEPHIIELESRKGIWSLLTSAAKTASGWFRAGGGIWAEYPAVLQYMWK